MNICNRYNRNYKVIAFDNYDNYKIEIICNNNNYRIAIMKNVKYL